MIDERQEELAALHAFGLLEGAERSTFERDAAASEELRGLVDTLDSTTQNATARRKRSLRPE